LNEEDAILGEVIPQLLPSPETRVVLGPERRMKTLVIIGVLLVAGATSIMAADASGKWTIKMDKDFRGNPGVPIECTFKQQGSELTVKCGTTGVEMKGRVQGRKLTWGHTQTGVYPSPTERLVLAYAGEIDETGTAVKGSWRLTSSVLDEKGTFEGKRTRATR
jgi:hypothetical protein